ncbi:MAG: cysteine synthase A [Symbiobacteriaceae bacterium]|nr:cysteine synthase A [Symbiobacteriaceae bacterium]
MRALERISDFIGNTPLLRLHSLSENASIYAKCEFLNPLSVKDRPVYHIICEAERKGQLKPGDTIIEATSGNTGMAVAYLAAIRGYNAILVMSESQSIERRMILQAFGAKLILTPAAEGTIGASKHLQEILLDHPEYFYLAQHYNLDNPEAHYVTTGPEIWRDTDGQLDILVAGLGTGGTICGSGRYLKEQNPAVQITAVEPDTAPFISQGVWQPHHIMGLSPGFVPGTLTRELIDDFALVGEEEAYAMCRQLAQREGILVGITSGAVAVALKRQADLPKNQGKIIVGILADTGQRYLSVEGLFDAS